MDKLPTHQEYPRAMVHQNILNLAESRPSASIEELAAETSGASPDLVERVLETYGDPGEEPSPNGGGGSAQASAGNGNGQSGNGAEPPPSGGAGPPVGSNPGEAGAPSGNGASEPASAPGGLAGYSSVQRETLEAIRARPGASQRELGEQLGISGSAVSQRVTDIPGLDWNDRERFVAGLFADEPPPTEPESNGDSDPTPEADAGPTGEVAGASENDQADPGDGPDFEPDPDRNGVGGSGAPDSSPPMHNNDNPTQLGDGDGDGDGIHERLAAVEARLDRWSEPGPLGDPELAHKVVHACLKSDQITEDEELQLLRSLLS